MSNKKTTYTTAFKTKLALETISELATVHNITPKNIRNWKDLFLQNAELAMNPNSVIKEYKTEVSKKEAEIEVLQKTVGKITIERDWLEGKLKSLDSSNKKDFVESELKTLSVSKQCSLLGLDRSFVYYKAKENTFKKNIVNKIKTIFEEIPIYGSKKVHQQLLEDGYNVCYNTVSKYRTELGLKAIIAVKQINTTQSNSEHKKYSYKIRGLDICRANQVWSTDITYIKIKGGNVYLAAIIDWYSKAVLSYKISNTMDMSLVMGVLDEALLKNGSPEIFNTDQGSQYTSKIHTQRLLDAGVEISMDGKGRATDNICIERFWRSAKVERIYMNEYETMTDLKVDVADYISFYNDKRFHQTLSYKKPMRVYNESMAQQSKLVA